MKNVVYVKHFENGKKYVGISSEFKKRMSKHNWNMNNDSQLPVYRAMRKYNHTTEIFFESDVYQDVLDMEILLIEEYKNNGVGLYNITYGGEGTLGLKHSAETKKKIGLLSKGRKYSEKTRKKMSGKNNSKAKPREYYATKTTARGDFKKTCKRQEWDFNNFKEIFVEWHITPNGNKIRKYRYEFIK